MSADRRGYRGRSWQWWAKRQLEYYTERQEARRVESFARTLDEIKSLASREQGEQLQLAGGEGHESAHFLPPFR